MVMGEYKPLYELLKKYDGEDLYRQVIWILREDSEPSQEWVDVTLFLYMLSLTLHWMQK